MGRKKQILVTGGAGFLGSHLCEKLLMSGHHVICLDNLHTGTKKNINSLLAFPEFQFIEQDLCVPFDFPVEEIYNLACPASPVHYQANPVQTTKTNILGALHVLELAKRHHAKVLQASTSEIYGDPEEHPQTEKYWGNVNPIGFRSCYDEGKRCAETLFFDYHRQYQTRIKVARIFNTYGPRMLPNDGRVVSNFIIQALHQKPMTIYGEGLQTRSFCYVDDLIEALILLMNSSDQFLGPVNLGNPAEFSILELAKLVIQLTNSRSTFTFNPLPSDDPRQRKPNIGLAQSALAWAPKTSLEDGLRSTISYFSECSEWI